MPVTLSTAVTEVGVALRARHVVTSLRTLDMDPALWALLGVSLAVLDDARPASQQLVSFPVVAAFDPAVPRRVAFEAPHKLAIAALDLKRGGEKKKSSRVTLKNKK